MRELVKSKEQLIQKLRSLDQDVFIALRDALNRKNRPISVRDIVKWLADVSKQLNESGLASQMIIYWDEFTTVLDKNSSDIHEHIQRIAEASSWSGVHLYLISHRTVIQGTKKEDRNKLLGRFKDVTYEMSDITTYLLMAHAIQKLDYDSWNLYRNKQNKKIATVIEQIGQNEAEASLEDIRDLYPIHPYTAHISSYIARVMGSTERSIFNFLNDSKSGFMHFINKFPGEDRIEYLTVDYIYDFFQKVFEEQNDPFFTSVLQKMLFNEKALQKQNKLYPKIMKAILIMNIAHHKINVGSENNRLVIPDEVNLRYALAGTHLEEDISGFLSYIDEKKIIIKDHNARYIVDAANYDQSEIVEWINKNRGKFKYIEEVFIKEYQNSLFEPLMMSHRRQDTTVAVLLDADYPQHLIKQRLSKEMKNDYRLHFALFIAKNLDEQAKILDAIPDIAQSTDEVTCYLVMDQLFTDDDLDRYLDFKSRAEVAHNKHNSEAEETARKNTAGHLNQWIVKAVKHGLITWFVQDKESKLIKGKCNYADFYRVINKEISQLVFYNSFDVLYPRMNVETAWKSTMAVKTAEYFLTCTNYIELSQKVKSGPMGISLDILADRNGGILVNEKLKIINNLPEHPLMIMIQKLENRFHGKDEVNLAEVFEFLFKPPYGIYPNHIFMAALGYIFRRYIGKLYSVKTGELLTEINLSEMIEKIYKYFCHDRFALKPDLWVRIGSENENQLVRLLEEMFELPDCNSIVDTRLKLADWLKSNMAMPLWLLKYSNTVNDDILIGLDIITSKILDLRATDARISPTEFKDIYNEIARVKAPLMTMLKSIDDNRRKSLFKSFISKEIEKVSATYNDEYYNDLMGYLVKNLQLDPIYWEEERVISKIKDWYIDIITPEEPPIITPISDKKSDTAMPTSSQHRKALDEVVTMIDEYDGDVKFLLIRLIKQDDRILNVVFDILSGNQND
ncbi:MAG: hypothetical protein PHO32_02360 [Candidatus Cloacimonetes bacterium]|nr:hypothetical protein [Candidatus Cloacimonadota bacterium]